MKKLLWIAFSVILCALATFLIIRNLPESPENELENARKNLSEARSKGALHYEPELYSKSLLKYNKAMCLWAAENNKFQLFRNYDSVKLMAEESLSLSDQAIERSHKGYKSLSNAIPERLNVLLQTINVYDSIIREIPLNSQVFSQYSKGRLMLEEAGYALKNGNLKDADKKLGIAENQIYNCIDHVQSLLKNYFINYPAWCEWKEKTLKYSRQKKAPVIIIDKFGKTCYVYYSGTPRYQFPIELGKNWIGDKKFRGDKATPEGLYFVTDKKQGARTKYYKAFLLNYPNNEDTVRFRKLKKNGEVPQHAEIGGLIEIHGGGGKGVNWTDGCIALRDSDMDLIFHSLPVNTPVTIIGSLLPLETIVKY